MTHISRLFRILLAFVIALAASCAAMRPGPVTVPDIVRMGRSGVPSDEIIRRMSKSGTVYRLNASQLARLRDQGVPDPVIDYMQNTYLEAVRRDARLENEQYWRYRDEYWYRGPGF